MGRDGIAAGRLERGLFNASAGGECVGAGADGFLILAARGGGVIGLGQGLGDGTRAGRNGGGAAAVERARGRTGGGYSRQEKSEDWSGAKEGLGWDGRLFHTVSVFFTSPCIGGQNVSTNGQNVSVKEICYWPAV